MIKSEIQKILEKTIKNLQKKGVFSIFEMPDEILIEHTENKKYGDYYSNVALRLAKIVKKPPKEIADIITFDLKKEKSKIFAKIEIVNGFIDFFITDEYLLDQLKKMVKLGENFGRQKIGKRKVVIIDYSSPNIAKPMHVGHLRSAIIGQTIYNIYKFLGYKVIGDNHLGDWGKQFGIMIAAIKKYELEGSITLEKIEIQQMLDIYIKFNQEIKRNEALDKLAKEEFKKLENGDKKNRKIWEIVKKKSLENFKEVYKILGIKFDIILGESFYEKYLKKEIKDSLNKNIATRNIDNSIIINLEKFNLPPLLIRKSDGATLYSTRDLATIRYRVKKYNPDKIIYVVGNEQALYFKQLFYSAYLLDHVPYKNLYHIKFGLILGKDRKKLATRTGKFIGAEDVMKKIVGEAKKIIKEKNPRFSGKETDKIATIIGIGSLKYNELSQNRKSDIVFNEEKMLNFKGDSAPYILYTYVRLKNILGKAKILDDCDYNYLKEKAELDIIKKLVIFPDVIIDTAATFQLNKLANYLYFLSGLVNNFYETSPVLKAEKDIKLARLTLIKLSMIVLKNGLNLLGIETLDKM